MSDFGFYSAQAFFAKECESRQPLIENILYERDSVILAGKAKTGKSILLFNLICSLTSGEPFLDRFETRRKCKVLYMQLEGSLGDSQDRFQRMLRALSFDETNFFIKFSPPLSLNDGDNVHKFIHEVETRMQTMDVLIIDPIYFAMRGSLSDDEAVRGFVGQLRIIQDHFKCAIILTHHFKKCRKDKEGNIMPTDDDDVFGSVFFQAWITHQFLFETDRSSKARTLQCNTQRSGKIVERLSLKLVEPDPLYFEELAIWPSKAEAIIKTLSSNQWMTPVEIYRQSQISRATFYREIKGLMVQSKIEKCPDSNITLYRLRRVEE